MQTGIEMFLTSAGKETKENDSILDMKKIVSFSKKRKYLSIQTDKKELENNQKVCGQPLKP